MFEVTPSSPIVRQLLQKQAQPENSAIRPLLYIMSGGMRGAYGAGAVLAFHALGLSDVFDVVVGTSTGAAIGAYFLAGAEQTRIGASIYYEECSQTLISHRRLTKLLDLEGLDKVFRRGAKKMRPDVIQQARSKFIVAMVNADSHQLEFIDAKTAQPDLIGAIIGSMSVPSLATHSGTVNGQGYLDGWFDQWPLERMIQLYQPTDIIVIANRSQASLRNVLRLQMTAIGVAAAAVITGQRHLAGLAISQPRRFLRAYHDTNVPTNVRVGVLWAPDDSVRQLTNNAGLLRRAVLSGVQAALQAFNQPEKKLTL